MTKFPDCFETDFAQLSKFIRFCQENQPSPIVFYLKYQN